MLGKRFPWAESIVSLALAVLAVVVMWKLFPGLKSEVAAAWIQAIGSIGAILGAVWVSADQQKRQRARDEKQEHDEVQNMLRSIRDEMYFTFSASKERNGKLLEMSEAGKPFNYKIPFAERPFPIYEACLDKFGRIPDDVLRQMIIEGHGHARGLVLSVRFNNDLVAKYEHADYMARAMNDDVHRDQLKLAERQLSLYGDLLRKLYKEACEKIEVMILALDKHLEKNGG